MCFSPSFQQPPAISSPGFSASLSLAGLYGAPWGFGGLTGQAMAKKKLNSHPTPELPTVLYWDLGGEFPWVWGADFHPQPSLTLHGKYWSSRWPMPRHPRMFLPHTKSSPLSRGKNRERGGETRKRGKESEIGEAHLRDTLSS